MSNNENGRGRSAVQSVKRGAEATVNGIHQVTAGGVQAVSYLVGQGLDKTGRGLSVLGQPPSEALHGSASRAANAVRNASNGTGHAGPSPNS